MKDFIHDDEILKILDESKNPETQEIRDIMRKSSEKQRLKPSETAKLLNVEDPELLAEMAVLAGKIKQDVYGNRIVFFAPLYIGNKCVNNCSYCAFRRDNEAVERKTLSFEELGNEVKILESKGQKRLILVYGDHPDYDADFISRTIQKVYDTKNGRGGEIRRVNINAAPMDIKGFRKLNETGIGTFQIFQETYHHQTYAAIHPKGDIKSDYQWRLYGLDRAMEAGIDDLGIGALFGLYDWKFEVMGLLYHTIHLEDTFGVGPHTISFPRLEPAINTDCSTDKNFRVSDNDFKKLVSIIRLSVPYTGMILTARESPEIRDQVIPMGVSQIDAGSRIALGGYQQAEKGYIPEKEQFKLGDMRSLDEVMMKVSEMGFVPSFCTAGYRCGRTGEHFMSFARPGLVHNFCMPNAILTFKEYLMDYASEDTRKTGNQLININLNEIGRSDPDKKALIESKLNLIEQGQRDVYV